MALKIGVIYEPLLVSSCALDQVCSKRGYLIDAARLACDQLHLNCSFFWYNSTNYGDMNDNDIGTGFIGAIQRGEFDTSIPIFTPTYRRYKAISFSEQFDVEDVVLMTRAPKVEQDLDWSIATAFQWQVWVSFLIVLLLTAGLVSFGFHNLQHKDVPSNETSLNLFFNLLFYLITNDFKLRLLNFDYIRFLIGTWIFGAAVFSCAYTCALFSNKISIENKLPFTNLETFVRCLETSKCRIVAPTLSVSYLQQLMATDDFLGDQIRKSFQYNPVRLTSYNDIPSAIIEEKNQFLVVISYKEALLYETSGNRDCIYYTVDLNYAEVVAFPFAKNSLYSKTLNDIALAFREFGLLPRLKKKYFGDSFCDDDWQALSKNRGQTLASMATTFCFYTLGISVALVAFLIEYVVSLLRWPSIFHSLHLGRTYVISANYGVLHKKKIG